MPKKWMLSGMLAGACMAGIAADGVLSYDFTAAPKLEITTKNDANNKPVYQVLLPLAPTAGGGFTLEFDLSIKTFNHYGHLLVGLSDGKKQLFQMDFARLDDRIGRCFFTAQNAPGLGARIKPWENIEAGTYHVNIAYAATARTVEFAVYDATNHEVYNSGAVKVSGKFNFDSFLVAVNDNGDEVSEISYDAENKVLFCRSYVGSEGEYAYMIEATLDNISLALGDGE